MAVSRSECRFVSVRSSNCNLPITTCEVDFRKDFCSKESIEEFVDSRESVSILDCLRVERAIVDTHSKSTIFLSDEKNRCFVWTCRRGNLSIFQEEVELLFAKFL